MCNKCYGLAVGYYKRQFKRLKGADPCWLRCSNSWQNSQRIHEGMHTSAARAVLEQYIADAGCPQPHRAIKRLCDGAFCTLVLLPMNTRGLNVFNMVNEEDQNAWTSKQNISSRFL